MLLRWHLSCWWTVEGVACYRFVLEGALCGREVAEVIGKYHLLAWLILYIIFIFLHAKEHELQSGWCGLDRLVLDHLQGLTVILDNYIPVI